MKRTPLKVTTDSGAGKGKAENGNAMMELAITLCLAALLIPAMITDLQSRRIANALVFPFWGIALALGLLFGGMAGLGASAAGLGIALVAGLVFWFPGWLGAGDVKLMAAVGGLTGAPLVWHALAAVALSGLLLALGALLWRGLLSSALQRYRASLAMTLAGRQLIYLRPGADEEQVRLPYALAIGFGTGWVWLGQAGFIPALIAV